MDITVPVLIIGFISFIVTTVVVTIIKIIG